MREIKFRAWDKKSKGWRYWVLGRDCMCDLEIYDLLTHYGQYTNLKDKNGSEIFEGDIIKYLYNEQNGEWVLGEVRWTNGLFEIHDDINVVTELLGDVAHISKIIGNIHQNPELLGD